MPLERVIRDRDLFAPLIPNPRATLSDIVRLVSSQDRQPPIYFAIAYLWMKLFPSVGGLVNLWGARALPAVLGSLTIPCVYIGTYLTFRRCSVDLSPPDESNKNARSIANFTAAMLAISPYGVFISQEARHYSLAIVWVTISINCLAIGSGILMLVFFAWVTPWLYRGIRSQLRQPATRIETIAILSFTLSSIGLYLIIPWLTGIDIPRGARYQSAIDVWLVNFYAPINLAATCTRSKQFTKGVYGYRYRLDRCQPIIDRTSSLP